jgi:putative component of membrane protein insertase Oxa1/YidC/SpoIIIJ protein YidD
MGFRKPLSFLLGLALLAGPDCVPASAQPTAIPVAAAQPVAQPVAQNEAPMSQAFLAAHGVSAQAPPARGPGPIKAFFSLLLSLYSNGVSPADGPTCAFAPTCAGYAGIAIHRHGLAEGILLTGDRLMRCNGYDKSLYPVVGSERHYFDPVP